MPIYKYECGSCGHQFEHLARSMKGDEPRHCPSCNAKKVQRRLSVFAARHDTTASSPAPRGACGRCGDPNGPCSN